MDLHNYVNITDNHMEIHAWLSIYGEWDMDIHKQPYGHQ